MRWFSLWLVAGVLNAEPLRWVDLQPALQNILSGAGLTLGTYPSWKAAHRERTARRLDEGAAEHIAYYILQSKAFTTAPLVDPMRAARSFFESLPEAARKRFAKGEKVDQPLPEEIRVRARAFRDGVPGNPRYKILRDMDSRLGWTPERIIQSAFRFLILRAENDEPGPLFETRGLSADPFPPSMRAVARGIAWLKESGKGKFDRILLAGPGAELGSRFGVDDANPVASPQPAALLELLETKPVHFVCADIRPEVTSALSDVALCRGETLDLAADRLPAGEFNLAVATNLLVYLDDTALAMAMANLARTLQPGGCLLHNDARFASRVFAEAADMETLHFEMVNLGVRNEREQVDRIVVQCKPASRD